MTKKDFKLWISDIVEVEQESHRVYCDDFKELYQNKGGGEVTGRFDYNKALMYLLGSDDERTRGRALALYNGIKSTQSNANTHASYLERLRHLD